MEIPLEVTEISLELLEIHGNTTLGWWKYRFWMLLDGGSPFFFPAARFCLMLESPGLADRILSGS